MALQFPENDKGSGATVRPRLSAKGTIAREFRLVPVTTIGNAPRLKRHTFCNSRPGKFEKKNHTVVSCKKHPHNIELIQVFSHLRCS
jgi:hypothetical protein